MENRAPKFEDMFALFSAMPIGQLVLMGLFAATWLIGGNVLVAFHYKRVGKHWVSPYQRIRNLEEFRDIVSHGKVVATQYVAERKEDGSHFQFKHSWDTYLSVDAVKVARADIRSFCQSLLVELRKHSDHLHVKFDAFEGSLASGSGTSKHG